MRPCEDVIVISDHEEGEITDSDLSDTPEPPRKLAVRPSAIFASKVPRMLAPAFNPMAHPKVFGAKFVRSGSIYRFGNHYRAMTPRKYVKTPLMRLKKMKVFKRKVLDSESGSDAENIPVKKKKSPVQLQRKKNSSSLKSRLTNMMEFDKRVQAKPEHKDGSPDPDIKQNKAGKGHTYERISDDNDISDDDADNLRELALKSKRLCKVQSADNLSNQRIGNEQIESADRENPDILSDISDNKSQDGDKEIQQLRLAALRSAIITRADKRKQLNKDRKERSSLSQPLNDSLEDDKMDVLSDISDNKSQDGDKEIQQLRLAALRSAVIKRAHKRKRLKKDIKRKDRKESLSHPLNDSLDEDDKMLEDSLFLQIESQNKLDYDQYMYNIPNPVFEPEKEIDNAESIPETINEDIANEELLRSNLLASMKSKPLPIIAKPMDDISDEYSNLIVRLGDSDSESDCEARRNLEIMHRKLEEQTEFQRNLDMYLKDAREAVGSVESSFSSKGDDKSTNGKHTDIKSVTHANHQEYLNLMKHIELKQTNRANLVNKNTLMYKKNAYSLSQFKNGSYFQNVPSKFVAIRKNVKINSKPVVAVKKDSVSETVRSTSKGSKVFEQQLISIRKKITNQLALLDGQKIAMKRYQSEKDSLERQLKNTSILLHNMKKAMLVNQREQNSTFRSLIQLRRYQTILQNRLSRNVVKKNTENVELNLAPKTISKIVITNKTDPAEIKTNTTVQLPILNSNNRVESVPDSSLIKTNASNCDTNDLSTDPNSVSDRLVTNLPNGVIQITVAKESTFSEYESPLNVCKSEQSWCNDPQGILCPFDVNGCCKDPKCVYIHSKAAT